MSQWFRVAPVALLVLFWPVSASAEGYGYQLLSGPESRDGITVETFTFDPAPVDDAAHAAGAARLPTPDPETDIDEHGTFIDKPKAMLGYVAGSSPTRLVVLCHGLNGDVFGSNESYRGFYHHLARFASPDVAVMALNYRNNFLFPVALGAHDVIAGTLAAKERIRNGLPPGSAKGQQQRSERGREAVAGANNRQSLRGDIQTTYLWGISMGGAISGTALSEALYVVSDPARPVFDHWVGVEPLVNFGESYLEARAFQLAELAGEMERDAGGTPDAVPGEYKRRTVVMNADRIAAAGLKSVTLVHAINDGLVPYNQVREMAAAAVANGMPTQLFTVVRKADSHGVGDNPDRPGGNNPDYTGTNTIFGSPNESNPRAGAGSGERADDSTNVAGLAGHAADFDDTHPVMRASFEQLAKLIAGEYDLAIPYREHCVDDQDGGSEFCTQSSAFGN